MRSHLFLALSEEAAFFVLDKHHKDDGEVTKCVQFSESNTVVGSL